MKVALKYLLGKVLSFRKWLVPVAVALFLSSLVGWFLVAEPRLAIDGVGWQCKFENGYMVAEITVHHESRFATTLWLGIASITNWRQHSIKLGDKEFEIRTARFRKRLAFSREEEIPLSVWAGRSLIYSTIIGVFQ